MRLQEMQFAVTVLREKKLFKQLGGKKFTRVEAGTASGFEPR